MKNQQLYKKWHHPARQYEQVFISPIMRKAAEYLRNARNKAGDWGYYAGLPTDIHASSLAVEALRMCKSPEFEAAAEDAVAHFKTVIRQKIDTCGIQELVDLLNMVSNTKSTDTKLESQIATRLNELQHGVGWGEPGPSLSLSCEVILAFMKLENPPQKAIEKWVHYLLECQHSDGGWGATIESISSAITTSQALRVINRFSDSSTSQSRSAAIGFIVKYFEEKPQTGSGDTFAISTFLRTLGEIEEAPLEPVHACIDFLYKRVNSDGGWGMEGGESSNVEHTALSMIALASAGENRFVSSRLARATLQASDAEITILRDERDRLSRDINKLVQDEIRNIIQERDNLLDEVYMYQERISKLESEVREMASNLRYAAKRRGLLEREEFVFEPGNRLVSTSTAAIIIVTLILLTAAGGIAGNFLLTKDTMLFIYFILTLVSTFSIAFMTYFVWLSRKRRGLRQRFEVAYGSERRFIVKQFIRIFGEWPPSKREEFLFRIATEAEKISGKKLEAYLTRVSQKYGERESQSSRLREVLHLLMELPPSARVSVVDTIRHEMRWYRK